MSFRDQLKACREACGLTRAALAEQLGVSASAVGNYETGVSFPKEDVLLRLVDALQVDPNYLYRDTFRHTFVYSDEERRKRFEDLFCYEIPALVISRNLDVFPECLEMAQKHGRTLLRTKYTSVEFTAMTIDYLNHALAPVITRHGVLVDVYGEGVLIFGDSCTNPVECLAYYSFNELRSGDLRHYTAQSLSDYIAAYQPDVVLCVRDYQSLLLREFNGDFFS